jgi:membrane protein YdbS with pleckstrin-like domain
MAEETDKIFEEKEIKTRGGDIIRSKVDAPASMFRKLKEGIFGSLQIVPKNFTFATQDSDEEIYILTRKDVLTNVGWVFQVSLFLILPIFIFIFFNNINFNINDIIPLRFIIVGILFYYSACFSYGIIKFNDWFFDVFIVTNKRVIHYIYNPIARYKIAEAELYNIQDVSEEVIGVLPTIFNYGDLLIQTASQITKFEVINLPRITELRDVLIDLVRLTREN